MTPPPASPLSSGATGPIGASVAAATPAAEAVARPSPVERLRELYEGHSRRAHRFRAAVFTFDLLTIAFIIGTSFLPDDSRRVVEWLDPLFGIAIAAELAGRLLASRRRGRELLRLTTWTDLVAAGSLLAPVVGEGGGFLRALRTLRLLRALGDWMESRRTPLGRRLNEDLVMAAANLVVFVFVMTALVYETQHRTNEEIGNYADALYFTVTALTTTGFGDITLPGTSGRMISVLIMLMGVTLFLRLAQVLFRPTKVRFPCPTCGLQRHEPDAVHCKACGTILAIPDEGYG